jgi:ABC-type Mn2+/Zn2+ transport system permease subunit
MDWLWEPFELAFFRNGFVVAIVAGGLCGLVGTFVVLRGMSYIGHGLSHAIFGGAAISAVVGLNYFVGAGVWGLGSALVIGRVTRRRIIRSDAAIGVVTTAGFAVGVAMFGLFGQARRNIEALLFGSILGIDASDVWAILAVTAFVAGVVFFAYRPLLFTTFDPEVADVSGVRTAWIDGLLMLALATSILVTMRVLGATLVAAGLVIPPVVARLLTERFTRMLWLSVGLGSACAAAGMLASYHLDIAPGAAVVLIAAGVFVLVYAATGLHERYPRAALRLGDDT